MARKRAISSLSFVNVPPFTVPGKQQKAGPASELRSPEGSSPHALGASVECGPGPELKCKGQYVSRYSPSTRGVLSRQRSLMKGALAEAAMLFDPWRLRAAPAGAAKPLGDRKRGTGLEPATLSLGS
jgi:hypothetical protein